MIKRFAMRNGMIAGASLSLAIFVTTATPRDQKTAPDISLRPASALPVRTPPSVSDASASSDLRQAKPGYIVEHKQGDYSFIREVPSPSNEEFVLLNADCGKWRGTLKELEPRITRIIAPKDTPSYIEAAGKIALQGR